MPFALIACQPMVVIRQIPEANGKTNSGPELSLVTLSIQRFLACNLWRNKILCILAFKCLVELFKSFDLIARASSVLSHVMLSTSDLCTYLLFKIGTLGEHSRMLDLEVKKPWKFDDFLWLIIENELKIYQNMISPWKTVV